MEYKYTILLSTLILFTILILNPIVTAQPEFTEKTNITLSVPCTINGDVCSITTICKATIINPYGTIIKNNETMLQNLGVFETNLSDNDIYNIGEYDLTIACTDGISSSSKTLTFDVVENKSGSFNVNLTETSTLIFILVLLVIALLMWFVGFEIFSAIIVTGIGFIFLLNDVNIFISIITIGVGVSITFMERGVKR